MTKTKETVLQIHLKALTDNYNYLSSKLSESTKFLAVVKAFAYGSDALTVAKHLQKLGADYFAVAYAPEGAILREAGISTPILVLHPQPENFNLLIQHCLEPSIYSLRVLNEFILVAENTAQSNYPVHICFNTGLNRLGFKSEDINTIVSRINRTKAIRVKALFSHLAASEDLNEAAFTNHQIETFQNISETFQNKIKYKTWLHICNTSGVLNYPKAHFDMVRCGIGLYGFGNSASEDTVLKPIASLKSVISQIHYVQPGESVGYNRSFIAKTPIKSATIPIGHADGIGRYFGQGKGYVTINNAKAPILGNVCMDMIMVNVTDIDCQEGDEVVIFDEKSKASHLANAVNTISYEIITGIGQRVKREIIE